jgi:sugar O-acyltransferase (sialic acid O-acetyltransferase NeuD family)
MTPLVILGAGGFGRELLSWIEDINSILPRYEAIGFLDDASTNQVVAGKPLLGALDQATRMEGVQFALAIAKPQVKAAVVQRLELAPEKWAELIHPTARIRERTTHGIGLILGPFSSLSVDVQVGNHLFLNGGAAIGHDSRLGDFCTLSPLAQILGGCMLGNRVSLGTSSVVAPGSILGDDVTLGPLTSTMRRVPDGVTLAAPPGRRL